MVATIEGFHYISFTVEHLTTDSTNILKGSLSLKCAFLGPNCSILLILNLLKGQLYVQMARPKLPLFGSSSYCFCFYSSQESTEKTLKLFQGYKRIADICQEGGGAGGKKAAGALTAKSNLTLQFVVTLLQALFMYV